MTDPERRPPYPTSPNPAYWTGGTFEGHLEALVADFYDEAHAPPAQVALYASWAPLEDLAAGDPPEVWGLDVGSGGPGGGSAPKRTQTLRGVVRRVSATMTGLLLEEAPDEWLNVSRRTPVDLSGFGAGDLVEVQVDVAATGKRYVMVIRRVVP